VTSPAAFDYRVYGLPLRANRRLPHLRGAPTRHPEHPVTVYFDAEAEGDGLVHIAYGSPRAALRFSIDPIAGRVWVNRFGECPAESIVSATGLLVGPVLGGLLRLRRTVSLHACVIAVDSCAVVVLADRGTGKSTLAASMAQEGYAVLSDDIAAIAEPSPGSWIVEPGYPRLRLRPDTIAALDARGAVATDAGPVGLGDDKRYLALSTGGDAEARRSQASTGRDAGAWRFQATPLPLGVIYELRRERDQRRSVVTALPARERVSALQHNMRAALTAHDAPTRADEFARLCRLAACVPIRRLACPDGLENLGPLCETLVADATLSARTG
jgi:hypothetical protein